MNTSVVRFCKTTARVCGVLAATIGFFGLLGWIVDVEALKAIFIGGITMKANAALCLMLLGTALFLLSPQPSQSQRPLIAGHVMAGLAMTLGGMTFVQHVSGSDFGIDQLLFREPLGAPGTASPGRMGPPASISFFLSGLALLLLDVRTRRGSMPAQWLALLVGLIALFPLIGYAYSIQSLFGLARYTGIAIHTAVAIAALAAGLLAARSTVGLMARVVADDAGGEMARRLLIPAILIPIVLGWLRTVGERAGLYEAAFGRPILILSLVVSFATLVWWNARALSTLGQDRKRAEEELRRSQRELSDFVENATVGMHWVGPDGRILWANRAEMELLGYAQDEYIGRHIAEFHADPPVIEDILCRLSSGQRLDDCEARLRCKDGSIKHVLINSNVLWADGRFVHTRCFTRDITAQKRADEARRMSEFRWRRLIEQSPLSTQVFAPDGTVRQVNRAWERLWGVTLADLPDYNILQDQQLVERGIMPPIQQAFAGEAATADPIPYVIDRGQYAGQVRWCGANVYPVKDEAGRVEEIVLIHNDVTEQRVAEEAVRESEQRLRSLIEQSAAGIGHIDLTGRILFANERFRQIVGYSMEELLQLRVHDLTHPDDRARTASLLTDGAATGAEYAMEKRYVRKDGSIVWVAVSASVIKDVAGNPQSIMGVVVDISDRKRAEDALRQAKEQAERASEAKSEFLATLSHELRTPLTPVLLTVSLMESYPALPDELRDDVATIRRNVELESRLISDLLDLTRITQGKVQLDEQEVDLHLMVRSAGDICQREASAKLTMDLRATRHTVRGDSIRLQQVFWNLINNAIKFTPAHGTITVRSSNPDDGCVRVEVMDSGVGIDPAVLPRLFTAFEQGEVRATRQQAGLGLGLAISKKLAEAHGGTITAASAGRGHGATFTVDLPVVQQSVGVEQAAPAPPGPTVLPTAAQSLNVLLVEDHEPTLRVMERLLRQIGHHVTGVSSVASASAAAQRDGFDLIICDLGLPDGSGLDVMRKLRHRYMGRAIALTGYGMESDIAASREAGFSEHLTKPVDLATLHAAIQRVGAGGFATAEGAIAAAATRHSRPPHRRSSGRPPSPLQP